MAKTVGYRACNQCGNISVATYGLQDGPCAKCGNVGYCLSDTEAGAARVQKQLVSVLALVESKEQG